MLFLYYVHQFADNLRKHSSQVVIFVNVVGEIVEAWLSLHHHQFPVATAHANLVCLVEFPVQMVMLLLLVIVAEKGGGDADAVKAVAGQLLVGVASAEILHTSKVAEQA